MALQIPFKDLLRTKDHIFFTFNSLLEALIKLLTEVWCWMRTLWMLRKLPGPPGTFIMGHSREMRPVTRLMSKVLKWQELYPVCQKTFLVFYPLIFVYSPEAIQDILSKKQKHNDKGFFYHALEPLLGDGLISSKGEKWFERRRMITPTFHFNILESFFEIFKVRTKEYIEDLKKSPLVGAYGDICPYTRSLTLNFICETAMGMPVGLAMSETAIISDAMHRLEEIGMQRCMSPWLLWDWVFKMTDLHKKQLHYTHILHSFTEVVVKRRRHALQTSKPTEEGSKKPILIDLLLKQSTNGKFLSDQDIREEVNTFMFAGQNTTQLAINFCIYLFGRYPKIQEKAAQEMDEIFGDSDRDPTAEDFKKMKYLEMCIKEALRLYPSVPAIVRRLTEDQTVGCYTLPKNTDCVIFPYILHRDPKHFPNPEEFNPDNFLPENARGRHPYSYIPFSAGPRNCIGRKFANMAEKTVISWVLREFTVHSLHKQEDLRLVPNTILDPIGGLKVKLTLRRTA